MGHIGAGKSSLINAIYTAFSPSTEIQQASYSHETSAHASTTLLKFDLPTTNITLWDSWGWTALSYEKGQMPFMLEGNLEHKFHMDTTPSAGHPHFRTSPSLLDRVHGVIIAIAADQAKSEGKEFWTRIDTFRRRIHERNLFGVVAVTKSDVVEAKVGENPVLAYSNPDVLEVLERVSEGTGFSPRNVLPVKLYFRERTRKPVVEALVLEVFADVVEQGKRWYETKRAEEKPDTKEVKVPAKGTGGSGYCSGCGTVRGSSKFCGDCGLSFGGGTVPKFCGGCSKARTGTSKFCADCGFSFATTAPGGPV